MRLIASSPALVAVTLLAIGCSSTSHAPDVVAPVADAQPAMDAQPATDVPQSDSPPAACTNTPDGVTITLIDTVPATATLPAVSAYHVVYVSTGGLHIHGQLCVPSSAGPHPIVVFNHGGIAGLGAADWTAVGGASPNQCYSLAAAGFIASMTQYRGESDALGGALGTLSSEGHLEFCAGEVDDSLALLAIAQRRCDADPARVGIWGPSHGGCITLESLRRGAPGVRAGVAVVPPTDLGPLFDYHVTREPGGDAATDACDPVTTHRYLVDAIATAIGTPASDPTAYAARSVLGHAADYAHVPVMIIAGLDDCTVPFTQSCAFQSALGTAGVSMVNYHLDAAGAVTSAPVAGCSTFGPLASDAWPGMTGFAADRYYIALDAQGHGFTGIGAQRALEALTGFLTHHI